MSGVGLAPGVMSFGIPVSTPLDPQPVARQARTNRAQLILLFRIVVRSS